jgi:hypothetical protein
VWEQECDVEGGQTAAPTDVELFTGRMMFTITERWPVMGNTVEQLNGPHLAGHPNSVDPIWHWIAITGYENWGTKTNYMDSATAQSAVVWPVQGWNTNFDTETMLSMLSGRGYIW